MSTLTAFASREPQAIPVHTTMTSSSKPVVAFSRKKKFMVYNPNPSQSGSAAQFDFNAQKESVFLEVAKQVPNPASSGRPGDNKFDWQNKLTVKLGLTDIGKILLVLSGNPKFQKADLFHDPQKSYEANESEGSEKKNATVSFTTMTSGYYVKVSIQQKDGKVESVGVGLTDDEAALLRVLLEQAVRRSYDW